MNFGTITHLHTNELAGAKSSFKKKREEDEYFLRKQQQQLRGQLSGEDRPHHISKKLIGYHLAQPSESAIILSEFLRRKKKGS